MGLLDLIFPKTCVGCGKIGFYLCQTCVGKISYLDKQYCSECGRGAIGGQTHPACQKAWGLDGLISLTYFSFPINKVIYALKYHFATDLVAEVTSKINVEKNLLSDKNFYLLPVPLHERRQNYRGFNQSEILGRIYAKDLGLLFSTEYIIRAQNTRAQVGLKRGSRLANVKGAFKLQKDVSGKSFVVFDDVWTTGATLKNIAQVLKRNGAKEVWGLTLARSH